MRCSGLLQASNSRRAGASYVRVMTTSRSAIASPAPALAAMTSLLTPEFLPIRVEPVEALRPKAAVVAEPLGGSGERRCVEAHRAELRVAATRDETCMLEHLQVLGDGGLAEIGRRHQLVHRGLAGGELCQDRPPRRIGES